MKGIILQTWQKYLFNWQHFQLDYFQFRITSENQLLIQSILNLSSYLSIQKSTGLKKNFLILQILFCYIAFILDALMKWCDMTQDFHLFNFANLLHFEMIFLCCRSSSSMKIAESILFGYTSTATSGPLPQDRFLIFFLPFGKYSHIVCN